MKKSQHIPVETRYEQQNPESSFFKVSKSHQAISNIQRRLYGITPSVRQARNIVRDSKDIKIKSIEIAKILHKNKNLANQLAYSAHNGKKWTEKNTHAMQAGILNQLQSGRALEILLAEAMMRSEFQGYHFLPTLELDQNNKLDLISRIPHYSETHLTRPTAIGKNHRKSSIGFGHQVTMANLNDAPRNKTIPETEKIKVHRRTGKRVYEKKIPKKQPKNRYEEKLEGVRDIVPHFHETENREKILQEYGAIYVPDIIAYTAINGHIREALSQEKWSMALNNYREWRKNNFDTDGLLEYFEDDFRNALEIIGNEIIATQNLIVSENFLKNLAKWKIRTESRIWQDFSKILNFNQEEQVLNLTIKYKWKFLSKTTFFLPDEVFDMLYEIHTK